MKKTINNWPIYPKDIKTEKLKEVNLTVYGQMFGALSQDKENPLSRVSQANSSFSLDPSFGCPLGCAYCVAGSNKRDLGKDWINKNGQIKLPKKIKRIFSGRVLIKSLHKHPSFIPNKSVISISTGSSEPFLKSNSEDTWSIMNYLISKKLHNPIWIVTKAGIPVNLNEIWKKRFLELKKNKIPIIVSITHSNLPNSIEPFIGERINNWKYFLNTGIYLSHHLRPIIRDVNSSRESILSCLKETLPLVKSVCIGGLRLDPGIILAWKYASKLSTSILPTTPGVKDMPIHVKKTVVSLIKELGYKTPIFEKSSEMISNALEWKDYNLYKYRNFKNKPGAFLKVPTNIQKKIKKEKNLSVIDVIKNGASLIGLENIFKFQKRGDFFYIKNYKKMTYQTERALIHSIGHLQLL